MKFFFNQPKAQNSKLQKKIGELTDNGLGVLQEGGAQPQPVRKSLLSSVLMAREPGSQFNWYSQNTSISAKGVGLEQMAAPKTVNVRIGGLLERIPTDLLSKGPHDATQEFQFKVRLLAPHIEERKPVVMLSTIAKACPELFAGEIPPDRDVGIYFPWHDFVGKLCVIIPPRARSGNNKTTPGENHGEGKKPARVRPKPRSAQDDLASPESFETVELMEDRPAAPEVEPGAELTEAEISRQSITGEAPSVEAIALERDEALRQRDDMLVKFSRMEEILKRNQEVIEASQDSARLKELVDGLTRERDEALAQIDQLKTALWHASEALHAVNKTGAKEQNAL